MTSFGRPSSAHIPRSTGKYASTPHLYLYQTEAPDKDTSDQNKDVIYSSAYDLKQVEQQKEAIKKITTKYDTLKRVTDKNTNNENSGEDTKSKNIYEVTDTDIFQIQVFFGGHKTQLVPCRCLCNLYTKTVSSPDSKSKSPWELKYQGIPLLSLDSGETKSRDKRKLQIILAEKGTGFMLWRDTIDNLTNYQAPNENFHTMHLSSDHRKMIGFSFDKFDKAREFHKAVEDFTSVPANISLSGPRMKNKKCPKKKPEKYKPPNKKDISQPCCFQHVTRVEPNDTSHLFTLQHFSQPPLSP